MTDSEIREMLSRYLDRAITLREFEEWFLPNTWNIHRVGTKSAQDLAYQIGLLLAEFSNGDWTENELRRQFKAYMDTHPSLAEQFPRTVPNINVNIRFFEFGKLNVQLASETTEKLDRIEEQSLQYSFPVSTAFSGPTSVYPDIVGFKE